MDVQERIREIQQVTGITDHAFARKLGVEVAALRDARDATTDLPESASSRLAEFAAAIEASRERVSSPRVSAPTLEEVLLSGDCREILRDIPDDSIDSIVTDIPYGIDLDAWDVLHSNTNSALLGSSAAQQAAGREFSKRRKPLNGWSKSDRQIPQEYYEWCLTWATECLRVLKPGGSAVIFAGRRYAHRCILALEDVGFVFRDSLAWVKPRSAFKAQPLSTVLKRRAELGESKKWSGWRVGSLASSFEPILWAFKPYSATIVDNVLDHGVGAINADAYKRLAGSYGNVLRFGYESSDSGLHAAQKPLTLLKSLIALVTPPEGIVLDPFAGSGTTGVAARQLGMRFVMIERDEATVATARARLCDPTTEVTAERPTTAQTRLP